MPSYRTLKILATIYADAVRDRYRSATPDEAPYALTDEEAVVRANDLPFDRELDAAATTLACIMLEPTEGVESRWVPRTDALSLDAEDDIETMAEIFARKAIRGYEPVPYQIVKEIGRNSSMLESGELAYDTLDSGDFTSEEVFQRVFDETYAIIEEWNESNGGLWWRETEPEPEPELLLDDNPRIEKDIPF
jgi:hypothetical protein